MTFVLMPRRDPLADDIRLRHQSGWKRGLTKASDLFYSQVQ